MCPHTRGEESGFPIQGGRIKEFMDIVLKPPLVGKNMIEKLVTAWGLILQGYLPADIIIESERKQLHYKTRVSYTFNSDFWTCN